MSVATRTGRFIGGGCDGQSTEYLAGLRVGTEIVCEFTRYALRADGNFYAIGTSTTRGGRYAPSATVTLRQVGRAWYKLMHALAVNAPRQLRQARAARRRFRKAVR